MIESRPQTEMALEELEKIIELYQSSHKTGKTNVKPVQKQEINHSNDILKLWSLGEFLKNDDVKNAYKSSNHGESDLEPFLSFHSLS